MSRSKLNQNKFALEDIVEDLPRLYKDFKKLSEEIIPTLDKAAKIEEKFDGWEVHDIGYKVFELVARGSPFPDAIRVIAHETKHTKKWVIYSYLRRYKALRAHQQYFANLCAKFLIDAGFDKKKVAKMLERKGIDATKLPVDTFESVCDGTPENDILPYSEHIKKDYPLRRRVPKVTIDDLKKK